MDADWSDLPPDLVVSIANRNVYLEDFAAFRATCISWRSNATKENFTGESIDQVPILMLPMNEEDVNSWCYSVRTGSFSTLHLPAEAEGDQFLSSLSWLLIVSNVSDYAWKLSLWHPFNHTRIDLPQLRHINCRKRWKASSQVVRKFVMSYRSSDDYIVFLIYGNHQLVFCRPGKDEDWQNFHCYINDIAIMDLACFNGEFYCVDYYGKVYSPECFYRREVIMLSTYEVQMRRERSTMRKKTYLVESAGALLVVFGDLQFKGTQFERYGRNYSIRTYSSSVTSFRVIEALLTGRGNYGFEYKEVKNLGNRSLFLSDRSKSFSFEVSHTCGLKANCIYFTNDESESLEEGAVMEMGVFDMED